MTVNGQCSSHISANRDPCIQIVTKGTHCQVSTLGHPNPRNVVLSGLRVVAFHRLDQTRPKDRRLIKAIVVGSRYL